MRVLRLFDKYFLILMIIQGFISIFIDSKRFKIFDMNDTAKKARVIGIGVIATSIVLYIITKYAS